MPPSRAWPNESSLVSTVTTCSSRAEAPSATRVVEVRNRDYFVLAPDAGLFEPLVELGSTVEAGAVCGQVHFVDNPGREPVVARFRASGTVISQRHFGRVERGDCVAHLATDWRG